MPKLPTLSGYSLDELNQLVALASKRIGELRGKRVKELEAELNRLGSEGARSSRTARKSSQVGARSRKPAQSCAATADRKIAAQFRGPNGEEYSGRGAIPRWARDLGVNDRAELEEYRIR